MNCLICGAALPAGAMFCGECGSSSTATPKTRKRPDPRPSDTTIIQPLPRQPVVISIPLGADGRVQLPPAAAPEAAEQPEPTPKHGAVPVAPESAPVAAVIPAAPPSPALQPPALQPPVAAPRTSLFVLQFSTGETVSAQGTGLVGRRPLPQPTERFDILVQVSDLGMSVSKSHLEFGQHDGEFWVSDRFSGNGTIIRRPDSTSVRCEPGRRYLVPRGSRVEIADQFFMVN
ncbi:MULTISPECIES: FHA domain-containing protein [Cryobacterium]|uniref:FHA domain-containing protein n=1 Tax=Cryobacterium mannosilyticum TaxID=1259190 RepID=A0A4V3IDM3_9MICO|nr:MULTISPECIES: FHA domain-containing protein [Cryobacterium]TFB93687.1 FHA domain-containing protein [Cryobacterium sp. HLT2-28]TFC07605.1 FHA domain-containing protein [Cryobacterium mannosilyticum]